MACLSSMNSSFAFTFQPLPTILKIQTIRTCIQRKVIILTWHFRSKVEVFVNARFSLSFFARFSAPLIIGSDSFGPD